MNHETKKVLCAELRAAIKSGNHAEKARLQSILTADFNKTTTVRERYNG